jgi:hypothetical protein
MIPSVPETFTSLLMPALPIGASCLAVPVVAGRAAAARLISRSAG